MPEVEVAVELTAEQAQQETVKQHAEELASFEAEFSDAETGEQTPPIVETPPPAPVVETPVVAAPVEPKYAQITEEQLARILTYSDDLTAVKAAMESRFGTAFGKIGSMSQTLKELQSAPQEEAIPVTITDEDMAHMKDDYPDLTPAISKALKNVMAKVKGGGQRTVTQQVDPETFKPFVHESAHEEAQKVYREEQVKDLTDDYPRWAEIIGADGSKTDFRQWLAQEPAEYQKKVGNSQRAVVVAKALDRYYETKRTPPAAVEQKPTAAQTRREQLQEAVTERGTASQATAQSEEDAFNAVFAK